MVKICNYSTLIISGNITVLLIVSILTDHWIYKGFKIENLKSEFRRLHGVAINIPLDTKSYIEMVFVTETQKDDPKTGDVIVHYLPPLYIDIWTNGSAETGGVQLVTHVVLFQQYGNIYRECDDLEGRSIMLYYSSEHLKHFVSIFLFQR